MSGPEHVVDDSAAIRVDELQPTHIREHLAAGEPSELGPTLPGAAMDIRGFRPLADEVRELEKRRIKEALDAARGIQSHAARLLSVPQRTFTLKLKRYGLKPQRRSSAAHTDPAAKPSSSMPMGPSENAQDSSPGETEVTAVRRT